MNIMLLIVAMILVGCTLRGYFRGFVKIIYGLLSVILLIGFMGWVSPTITDALLSNSKVYDSIEEKCEDYVRDKYQVNESESLEEELALLAVCLSADTRETVFSYIQSGTQQMSELLIQQLAEDMTNFIIKGLGFLIALIIGAILLHMLGGVLNFFAGLPIVRNINKLLGFGAGLFQGLIYTWILMYVIAVFCTTDLGQTALYQIQQSQLLTYLYTNNGLVTFTSQFF